MDDYNLNEYDIMNVAQKLSDAGFLSRQSTIVSLFSKVDYKYKNNNEIMFFVKWNDNWDNKDIARKIVDAFNKHGFKARYDVGNHIFVEVNNYEKNIDEEIEDCFDGFEW